MSPGARGDFLTDRPAPGRRDVAPPEPQYGYPPPSYYPGVPPAQTWLGAPLISIANPRRGCKPFLVREEVKKREELYVAGRQTQYTKMAMHAQGAPLIIQGRYTNQRKYFPPVPEIQLFRKPEARRYFNYDRCDKVENFIKNSANSSHAAKSTNMDAVSVTSDESSGSANSEAALPRIIKPRKRRKKDRKPNNITGSHDMATRKHDLNDDPLEPQSPAPGAIFPNSLFDDNHKPVNSYRGDATVPYASETTSSPENLLKNYSFSSFSITDGINIYDRLCETESIASVCQCRYCDPSGHIWDIDSVGFSELFDESSTVDFAPTKLEDSMKVVGSNSKKANEVKDRDTTLRRSWSDPSSAYSTATRKIYDQTSTAETECFSSSDLCYSLFSSTPLTSRAGSIFGRHSRLSESDAGTYRLVPDLKLDGGLEAPSNLEVSSEIVTSLNGHRDLEIKFFSSSPPATAKATSFFAENNNSDKVCSSVNVSSEVTDNDSVKSSIPESKQSSETSSEVT